MGERKGNFMTWILVGANPIARLYQQILGVSDLVALDLAKEGDQDANLVEPVIQIETEADDSAKDSKPPATRLSARERYGDVKHAIRYGDYGAAREIEKENRRNFRID